MPWTLRSPDREAVLDRVGGQLRLVTAVGVHDEDLMVAVTVAVEDDLRAIG